MYQSIIVLHVNDSPQVVLAARFIWRRHSNTTTLRFPFVFFPYKSRDFAYLCDFVAKFEYAVTQDLLARLT